MKIDVYFDEAIYLKVMLRERIKDDLDFLKNSRGIKDSIKCACCDSIITSEYLKRKITNRLFNVDFKGMTVKEIANWCAENNAGLVIEDGKINEVIFNE